MPPETAHTSPPPSCLSSAQAPPAGAGQRGPGGGRRTRTQSAGAAAPAPARGCHGPSAGAPSVQAHGNGWERPALMAQRVPGLSPQPRSSLVGMEYRIKGCWWGGRRGAGTVPIYSCFLCNSNAPAATAFPAIFPIQNLIVSTLAPPRNLLGTPSHKPLS